MKKDRFWKYFLLSCALVVVGGSVAAYGVIRYVAPQSLPAIALPGGIGDTLGRAQEPLTATTTGFFFNDSVPFGYDKWSWGASVNWRTNSHYYEGAHALSVAFNEPWSGVEIAGPGTITSLYSGISLAVYIETGIDELYVELYRKDGSLVGRQLLQWYAPEKKLSPGMWQQITIPLQNFDGTKPSIVGRVAIIGESLGQAYFDSIQLVPNALPVERWQPATPGRDNSAPPLADTLKQATTASLPYNLEFTPLAAGMWHSLTGTFQFTATEALLGLPENSTDSMPVFLGGLGWRNYRVDAVVDWGTASTFSLLSRIVDEQNFVSCAFSGYGMYAQIYQIHKGESTLIAETPELAIPQIDAWKGVAHGMVVQGDRVTCLLNGEKILSATLPTLPPAGTIGMEAWGRDKGGIPHRIHTFTVTPL